MKKKVQRVLSIQAYSTGKNIRGLLSEIFLKYWYLTIFWHCPICINFQIFVYFVVFNLKTPIIFACFGGLISINFFTRI